MNCDAFEDLLGDYVDGVRASDDPGNARRAAFESHLPVCARCQALVTDFSRIRVVASALEEQVPPPRLWAKVSSSVERQPRRAFAWLPLAVAASLAVVIAGATWLAWRDLPAPAAPEQATVEPGENTTPAAEAEYEQAIAGLQRMADAQDAALDPQTRVVLQRNLAAIDRAIDESRAALSDEPASALAQESLLDALDTKVTLLQDTVALTTEDVLQ
jgi:hypothetical protein